MPGVRGRRPFLPKKGGAPTGILSTHGRQKKDPLSKVEQKNKKYTASEYRGPKVDPVKRDNRIRRTS